MVLLREFTLLGLDITGEQYLDGFSGIGCLASNMVTERGLNPRTSKPCLIGSLYNVIQFEHGGEELSSLHWLSETGMECSAFNMVKERGFDPRTFKPCSNCLPY